jgi:hypothetical protein
LIVIGCAGKGERINVAIPGKWSGPATQNQVAGGLRIAVVPFEDQRRDRAHLGTRSHLTGGVSYFDLPSGTIGDTTAQALAEYLTRHGWRASLSRTMDGASADATILGSIQDLSLDAKSGFMHTDLTARNSMVFQITNHADESSVHERVSGTGTDQVFWFDAEDAQSLTTELLETNFQKFLSDLKVDGRSVRLK